MKKIILILIFGTVCLWSYPQSGEEIVLKIHKKRIAVYLSKFPSSLEVECPTKEYGDWFYKKGHIYWDNDKTLDSLFQNLYDWIKEIEDFATNLHRFSMNPTRNRTDFETIDHIEYSLYGDSIYIYINALSYAHDNDKKRTRVWSFLEPE